MPAQRKTPAGRRQRTADRTDRVEDIYQRLRDVIVRGRLAPGARLVEATLVTRFQASRGSVRAAVQRLRQEGYLGPAGAGQAGLSVTPLTNRDAWELFAIVAEIEGLAAESAANLPTASRRVLVTALTRTNADYRRAAKARRPDGDQLFRLDTQFHRAYVRAGAGPRLMSLHDAVKPQLERYVRIYQTLLTDSIATSVIEHAAIAAEIATGSGRGAHEAVRTNWRNAASRLRGIIDARGEAGSW